MAAQTILIKQNVAKRFFTTKIQETDIIMNNLMAKIQPFIRYKKGTYHNRLHHVKSKCQGAHALIRMHRTKNTYLFIYAMRTLLLIVFIMSNPRKEQLMI